MTIDLDTPTRQRLTVAQHVSNDIAPVQPVVRNASGIAVVEIIDGLHVQSDDPAALRTIADAFLRAAASIEALSDGATWNAS